MSAEEKLYRRPGLPALVAYGCAAMMLFFAGLNIKTHADIREIEGNLQKLSRLDERVKELERENVNLREGLDLIRFDRRRAVTHTSYRPRGYFQSSQRAARRMTRPVQTSALVNLQPQAVARGQQVVGVAPPVVKPTTKKVAPAPVVKAPITHTKKTAPAPVSITLTPPTVPVVDTPAVKTNAVTELWPPEIPETQSKAAAPKSVPPVSPELAIITPDVSEVLGKVVATHPREQRVLLSLGATSGLERGKRFVLSRGGRVVAQVRVAQVFQDMSMCDIIGGVAQDGVRVGDAARLVAKAKGEF